MLNSWWQRWLTNKNAKTLKQSKPPKGRQSQLFRHLSLELLENRILPVITAIGTNPLVVNLGAGDTAIISAVGANINVNSLVPYSMLASSVTGITVVGTTGIPGNGPETLTFTGIFNNVALTGGVNVSDVSIIDLSAGPTLSTTSNITLAALDMENGANPTSTAQITGANATIQANNVTLTALANPILQTVAIRPVTRAGNHGMLLDQLPGTLGILALMVVVSNDA